MPAQTSRGWRPTRWVEAELVDGEVVLRDLKPGTYRLLRVYRAAEPQEQPSGGHWIAADVQVTLVSGKMVTAPPLFWKKSP